MDKFFDGVFVSICAYKEAEDNSGSNRSNRLIMEMNLGIFFEISFNREELSQIVCRESSSNNQSGLIISWILFQLRI